jgi:hypothetical protein
VSDRAQASDMGHIQPGPGPGEIDRTLDESMLPADPMDLFAAWMDDVLAAGLPEPTAMALATVSAQGQPRARMVLLKAYDDRGFAFYTNRTSRKGSDLAAMPRASLLFPWYAIQRQVIVEGRVTQLTVEQSEPYFHAQAARLPARGLGQLPVRGHRLAGRTGRPVRGAGAALAGGDAGADAGLLGRIPGRAGRHRVLARPGVPDARPLPVPP